MEEKERCQSCGMPLDDHAGHRGTEADARPASEYCQFCYQDGHFTDPDQTVDGMVRRSADFMTSDLGYEREEAERMSNDVIRRLKRWN